MTCPLDIKFVPVVERQLNVFSLKLVDDSAIVNSMNRDLPAAVLVEQSIALFPQSCNVDRRDVESVFIDAKIRASLLLIGIDLSQNNIFRIVIPNDNFPKKLPIGLAIKTPKMSLQTPIQAVNINVLTGKNVLIPEDGGKRLHLHEPGAQRAIRVANQPEVHSHEIRLRIIIRHAKPLRNGLIASLQIFGIVEKLSRKGSADLS